MRRLFVMGVLFAIAIPVLAEPSASQSQLSPLEIRIPSITKKWKLLKGSNKPEITIGDIERCIGQDVSMQQEVRGLKLTQSQLESERDELNKANADLAQVAQAQEIRRQAHQARVDQFQADSANLAHRLSDIDKRKAAPAKTRQDLAQTNQLIAIYNADVTKLNGQRPALLEEQGAINQTVATLNEDVARTNQLVATFNERNGGFQSRAAMIASTSAAFHDNWRVSGWCANEAHLRSTSLRI
ncbi:hypothetical protein [Aquabacterium sp. NJ1]|uniref:hypothetical protein n=1 Tax=Aquabacterium sp. NJ1 TaxID=1538295 RepID=UPI00126A14E4|nr:hypothetical protein [Aquabacterium sp. NJ1]